MQPGFGSTWQNNNGFGAPQTPSAQNNTGFKFTVGNTQPNNTNPFGANQSSVLKFGQPQQPTGFGTGGNTAAQPAQGGTNFTFGNQNVQQNQFGQNNATTGGFSFGNNNQLNNQPTTAGIFGQNTQNQQNQQNQSNVTFDTLLGEVEGEELNLLKQLKTQINSNQTAITKITESMQTCASAQSRLNFQLQTLKHRALEATLQTKAQGVQLKSIYDKHVQQRQCVSGQQYDIYVSNVLNQQLKDDISALNMKNITLRSKICLQNDISVLAEQLKAIQAIEAVL